MAQSIETVEVETGLGRLAGLRGRGLCHFRGVPFAEAPIGEFRFRPPRPKLPWTGTLDVSAASVIAPQLASRLVGVMGEFERTQSEDCLRLTIVTPGLDGARRPVVVWLHGGGFSSGSGGLDWYDGSLLAAEGDVVVIGVNYRLGALGYLFAPGLCDGNLGLLDQALALRFIREHAACFGGDPDNICLMGQSAGGNSIAALFAGGHDTKGVRRAILQSAAFGMSPQEAVDAARLGADFVRALGADPSDAEQARAAAIAAPVDTVLAAQAAVARQNARYGDTAPPFQLVRGAAGLPSRLPFHCAAADAMDGIDVLIGVTAEEAEAFFALDPRTGQLDDDKVVALVGDVYGDEGMAQLGSLKSRLAGAAPARLLSQFVSKAVFVAPALDFAERRAARGGRVHFYDFAWQPGGGALGSCHCLELPFVFGPTDAWQTAPMLSGADTREIADLSSAMRAAWLAFIRTGRPDSPNLPEWPTFTPERPGAMRFDRQPRLYDMRHGS